MLFILWLECYAWGVIWIPQLFHLKADNLFSHCYLWGDHFSQWNLFPKLWISFYFWQVSDIFIWNSLTFSTRFIEWFFLLWSYSSSVCQCWHFIWYLIWVLNQSTLITVNTQSFESKLLAYSYSSASFQCWQLSAYSKQMHRLSLSGRRPI